MEQRGRDIWKRKKRWRIDQVDSLFLCGSVCVWSRGRYRGWKRKKPLRTREENQTRRKSKRKHTQDPIVAVVDRERDDGSADAWAQTQRIDIYYLLLGRSFSPGRPAHGRRKNKYCTGRRERERETAKRGKKEEEDGEGGGAKTLLNVCFVDKSTTRWAA